MRDLIEIMGDTMPRIVEVRKGKTAGGDRRPLA
jgi:hypothetical protein